MLCGLAIITASTFSSLTSSSQVFAARLNPYASQYFFEVFGDEPQTISSLGLKFVLKTAPTADIATA